jgi:hypothetical protein
MADDLGVGPSMTTSAFLVTYLVKLPTTRLLASWGSVLAHNFRVARDSGTIAADLLPEGAERSRVSSVQLS